MFRKILVPYDGSEIAGRIFPQVVELAKVLDAQITLLHVCHTESSGEASPGVLATAPVSELKACESFLSRVGKELQSQGTDTDWVCVEGVPAREIIVYADRNGMDLIAMATHGRGEVAWVLGSVAEQVVTHATLPVLLFRVIEVKPPLLKEEYFK